MIYTISCTLNFAAENVVIELQFSFSFEEPLPYTYRLAIPFDSSSDGEPSILEIQHMSLLISKASKRVDAMSN